MLSNNKTASNLRFMMSKIHMMIRNHLIILKTFLILILKVDSYNFLYKLYYIIFKYSKLLSKYLMSFMIFIIRFNSNF